MVTAETVYGTIKGKKKDGMLVFRGIPYAKPPVGDLRFRPPVEPKHWEGIKDCTKFGAPSLQLFSTDHVRRPELLDIASEDCLYLNVSTPAFRKAGSDGHGNPDNDIVPDENAGLPVYVFIHGGAFETGGSNMSLYRGEKFAQNGIVYVNINYRLGIMGFFALEEFKKESGYTGCFGILDALSALKWVKKNISRFGGDPENITVGGESAGAYTVSVLMMMKEAKGLFKRCILESGSITGISRIAKYGHGNPMILAKGSLEAALDLGADDSAKGVETLRKMPAEKLTLMWTFRPDGSARGLRTDPVLAGLISEDDIIPNPMKGYINDVDLLFGFNTDEGTLFAPPDASKQDYLDYLNELGEDLADEIYAKYPVDENHTAYERYADLIGLEMFKSSMLPYADRLAHEGKKVYGYHFNHMTDVLRAEGFGCRHIAELNFVFNKDLKFVGGDNEDGAALADFMNQAWCGFIKNGDPGSRWTAYSAENPQVMRLEYSAKQGKKPACCPLPREEEMRYFQDIIIGKYNGR